MKNMTLKAMLLTTIMLLAFSTASFAVTPGYFKIGSTEYKTEDEIKSVTRPDSTVVTKGCTIEVYGKVQLPVIIRTGTDPSYPDFTWVLSQDNVTVEGKTDDATVYCAEDVNKENLGGMVGLQSTVHVYGNSVTFKNLAVLPNYNTAYASDGYANKTVEVWGNGFTMDNCKLDINDIDGSNKTENAGALFFDGPQKKDITIKNSYFKNCFVVFCDVLQTSKVMVTNNTFDTPQGDTYFIGNNTWANPANETMGPVYVENNTFKNLPADYKKIVYHRMTGIFYLKDNKIESSTGSDKMIDRVSFGKLQGSMSSPKDCASDGKAVIYVTENGKEYKITSKIESDAYVNVVTELGVEVDPSTAELVLSLSPTATLKATSKVTEDFTWKSANESVVKVDASGNITAVAAGTANVTATGNTSGSIGTCVVTVRAASPVSVTPAKLELKLNGTGKVTAAFDAKDSITWSSSNEAVATVANGTVTAKKAGIAVITAKGKFTSAACTVTVIDTANPDPTPTPDPIDPGTVDETTNPVNNDKDKPAEVKPVTPAITEATDEGKAKIADKTAIASKDLVATANGTLTVSPVLAKSALEAVKSADSTVAPKSVALLPIVTATVEKNKVAAMAFTMTGAEMNAEANSVVKDIKLIKVLADGAGAQFTYVSAPADYADKTFTIKNADGKNLADTDKIETAATYTLIIFVADNGAFDLDKTEGSVIDPVAVATNAATEPTPTPSGSGSSGGCSASAFGFLLALLAAPMIAAKRRSK